jgi:hypothetical protein
VESSIQLPPGFEAMSAEEKIAYVQALWDLISASPAELAVPGWHQQIIDARLEQARGSDQGVRPWGDVRAELQQRVRSARGALC